MAKSEKPRSPISLQDYDPIFRQEMQRLHQLMVYGRWSVVIVLWLSLAPLSLWNLRGEIALWLDYFTWTAVRYSLAYNPIPTFCLALCIGMTVSVLIWQSTNILGGLSQAQIKHLEKQVIRIRQQGKSHPLWTWVIEGRKSLLIRSQQTR
jgi:hypothetical protein